MKSTFKTPTGGEIVVQPSPTGSGVWLLSREPQQLTVITAIPLHMAGIVSQAIEATATVMEEACLRPELPADYVGTIELGALR